MTASRGHSKVPGVVVLLYVAPLDPSAEFCTKTAAADRIMHLEHIKCILHIQH